MPELKMKEFHHCMECLVRKQMEQEECLKHFGTIPVIGQIIEDMRELCPDAWLINFTNPSGW